jgi:hypothetical protein
VDFNQIRAQTTPGVILADVTSTASKKVLSMAIFISYSHADEAFARELATRLVENNAHVWIDSWELNVGDSLIDRIQSAIQDASALLVILSKASVESEWCKRELNTALVRELEEKKVIVLPVLKEDCSIPPFLREKKYADFRREFDAGFDDLLSAVAKVSNPDQGRMRSGNMNTDWAETWWYDGDAFHLEWELVESSPDVAFTILTTISVKCNPAATRRYREYEKQGLDWIGRMIITQTLPICPINRTSRYASKMPVHKSSKLLLKTISRTWCTTSSSAAVGWARTMARINL